MFLPAFLQISSVTYAEPGRGAKSRWESAGEAETEAISTCRGFETSCIYLFSFIYTGADTPWRWWGHIKEKAW